MKKNCLFIEHVYVYWLWSSSDEEPHCGSGKFVYVIACLHPVDMSKISGLQVFKVGFI